MENKQGFDQNMFFSDCRFCNNEFQMQAVLPLVEAHSCVSVAEEGKVTFSQTAELKWGDKRITQSMKYQVISLEFDLY